MISGLRHISLSENERSYILKLYSDERSETLTSSLIIEMIDVLEHIAQNEKKSCVVISGGKNFFCTGMDLSEVALGGDDTSSERYFVLLNKIFNLNKITICSVEAPVMAGGVGIIAASDFVFADKNAFVSLPESLWGLIPSCLTPFLINRVGYKKALQMSLSSLRYSSQMAYDMQLFDFLCEDVEREIVKFCRKIERIDCNTIKDIKSYFSNFSHNIVNRKSLAVNLTDERVNLKMVQENISRFINLGKLPWE